MTHCDIDPEDQQVMNITSKLVRLSVGVEHPDDLMADISQALERV